MANNQGNFLPISVTFHLRFPMIKRLFTLLLMTSFLAACAGQGGDYGSQSGPQINKQAVGGVSGAVIGGVLGSQLGGGKGQLWTTGAGVLLGALAGSEIGKSLDKADQMYAQRAFSQVPSAPVGQEITWSNPESGNSGTYEVNRTGRTNDNRSCREFTQTIMIGGKSQQGVGVACQNPDGSWAIQGN
jgi:surface antigen